MSSAPAGTVPSRWWIPLTGLDPQRVRLAHLHGAVSSWFDLDAATHAAPIKPYALSPLRTGPDSFGFELSVLSESVEERFGELARPGRTMRLGSAKARVAAPPTLIGARSWASMAAASTRHAWALDFVTPTTFRQGRRTSPLPTPAAVLRGLAQRWAAFSPIPLDEAVGQAAHSVWVSDIDGSSDVLEVSGVTFSGFVGRVRYQCDDEQAASAVTPLFELAPFAGVGAATTKGLGCVRMERTWQPGSRQVVA